MVSMLYYNADETSDAAIRSALDEGRAQLMRYKKDPMVNQLANLHKYVIVASLRGALAMEEIMG